jgi:hypothetical protein
MKRIIALMLAALCALLFAVSCDRLSIPGRMEALAAAVEKNGPNYTQDQWVQSNEKFDKLYKEYLDKKGSLTQDEIKRFRTASAQYVKTAFQAGFKDISNTLEDIGEQIPGLIEEIGGFFKSLGESLSQEETPAE